MNRLICLKGNCIQIIVCTLLVFCSLSASAHPFLWKATGEHEFYLFGTIHLPDPRVTHISDKIANALADSNSFYAELDLSEKNTMLIKQSMWLPDKKTLYDYLSKDLQDEITHYLKLIKPELNLEFFAKQKIWVLAITLTVLEQQLKYPGLPPLDTKLFDKATSLGLNTGGLETIDEQLGVFESLTTEQQLTFLDDTVEFMRSTIESDEAFIEESITAYLAGDLDILMNHLISYMKDNEFYDLLLERLIDQRNLKMVDKMLSLTKQSPNEKYFFAVGAGHFWGDKGIHSILEERGYKIQSVE